MQLELQVTAGSGSSEVINSSSSSNSGYGGFKWSNLTVSETGSAAGASLTLTVSGLVNSLGENFFPYDSLTIEAIGSGFTGLPTSSDAFLTTVNSSGTYSDSTSGDQVSMHGTATSTATVSNTATNFAPPGSTSSDVSYTIPSTSINATRAGFGTPSSYSLDTFASFTIKSTSSSYNGTFVTTLAGSAPAAVTLPGSGPLTIVGGLVVVGGLAVRRRFKV